jgi:hypothetical protein
MTGIKLFLVRLLIPALLLSVFSACGKAGPPRPRQTSRSFAWQKVSAMPVAGCLDIHGVMSGVYSNLDQVILEFSENGDGQDCSGCPFLPGEKIVVPDLGKVFDSDRGELRFYHCPPLPASAYRFRLVGVNIFDSSSQAVSPEIFVSMP